MPHRTAVRVRALLLAAALPAAARAATVPVRIATYNVDADTGATTVNDAAISTVLGGLGSYNPDGLVHPLDLLALEETTSNATTVAPIAADLNALYNTSTYTVPALQPGESDNNPTVGNGPSSIVYNRATLQLLAATTIGPANGSTNGVYRQVARYEFEPAAAVGGTAAGAFYVYVEHAKSGSTSADLTARAQETALVRADADALPAGSRVVYVGDFNIGASTEQSIANLEAQVPAANVTASNNNTGQAVDPLNMPGNYALNSTFKGILTESSTDLRYRDDLQLVTTNVMNSSAGLQYVPGSYTAFGNNGTTPEGGTVNASSNTALPGLPNRAAVLTALTQVTDHLPVVADYADVVTTTGPTTPTWAAAAGGTWGAAANWSPAAVPNAPGVNVTFGPSIAAPATVTLDSSYVAGRLTFNASNGYTIAAAPGTANTLYLNDVGDPAGVAPSIAVLAGQHTIAAGLYLAGGVTITTAPGSSLTLATSVAGSGPVTVAGTLIFAANATGSEAVRSVPGLALAVGSAVTVAGSGSVLTTPFLTLAQGSVLNLGTNDLTIANSSPAAVTAMIAAGRIAAAPDPSNLRTLGVIANDDGTGHALYGSAVGLGLFDTTSPPTDAVLVRYTFFGDANLDGRVDGADYALIDAGYASGGSLTGWYYGDFNADGVVDASDYTLIDNAFNEQPPVAVATAEVAVTVPEPATLAVLTAAVAATLARRRPGRARPGR